MARIACRFQNVHEQMDDVDFVVEYNEGLRAGGFSYNAL